MEWLPERFLEEGQTFTLDTPAGTVDLGWQHGRLRYVRRPLEGEPIHRTIALGAGSGRASRSDLRWSILPAYPDRPVVFRLTDSLIIPPRCRAFVCLRLPLGFAIRVGDKDTLVEHITLHEPRSTWWGEPHRGVLCYDAPTGLRFDSRELLDELGPLEAIVPVIYENAREHENLVERCLVSIRELSLFADGRGRLALELVRVVQTGEHHQEPRSRSRIPRELQDDMRKLIDSPFRKLTLLERLRGLSLLNGAGAR